MSVSTTTPARGRGRPSKFPAVKQSLRSAILRGDLKPGQQLPAFHQVAKEMGVAGLTAKRAIDELAQEGWLSTQHGVGTFVRVRRSESQILLTAPRQWEWIPMLSNDNLDAFHDAHPNVRLILSSEPSTDLIVTNSYSIVVDRIRRKHLLSLDELQARLGRTPWEIPKALRDLASWEGTLYALPVWLTLMVLQTNPTLLESFGVRSPVRYLDWEQYQEILNRCRRDRDGDGWAECVGSYARLSLHEWLVPFWQNGGSLADREAFFRPAAFSVLDTLWRMHHVDRTLPLELPIGGDEFMHRQIRRRFANQQIAMHWVSADALRRFPFPTSIVLPRFGPVPRQMVHGAAIGIHQDCAHPDVALEFLDFCYRRFIERNAEYPFVVHEEDRPTLRQLPEIHRLLREGFESASEPLHEGVPQRTWAIENELFDWFRLFIDRKQLVARLQDHWDRETGRADGGSGLDKSFIIPGEAEAALLPHSRRE